MKKKIISMMMAGTLLLSVQVSANEMKYEGPGFDTAKEAAAAYMEAFDSNDVEGMLSACAVESYVDHYDLAYMVARLGCWNPSINQKVPNTNSYTQGMNLLGRISEIDYWITNQYMSYSMAAAGGEYTGSMIKVETSGNSTEEMLPDAEALLENTFADPIWVTEDIDKLAILTPDEFFEPVEIDIKENYFSEVNQQNIVKQNKVYGAEEVQELICLFTIGDLGGTQFINTGKYNGKWYVLGTNTNLNALSGIDTYLGGLVIDEISEEDYEFFEQYF